MKPETSEKWVNFQSNLENKIHQSEMKLWFNKSTGKKTSNAMKFWRPVFKAPRKSQTLIFKPLALLRTKFDGAKKTLKSKLKVSLCCKSELSIRKFAAQLKK